MFDRETRDLRDWCGVDGEEREKKKRSEVSKKLPQLQILI